jgi:hypothetical protein
VTFDDELLLTSLGAALETVPRAASVDELDEFRALVAGQAAPGEAWSQPRSRRHPVRAVLVAAAATASLVLIGGAGMLATGDPLPSSLRAPVRALGIPVDDSALARARTAMRELRIALDGPDDARARVAALALADQLRALGAADRAEIDGEARTLIRRADERLNGGVGVHTDALAPPTSTVPSGAGMVAADDGASQEVAATGAEASGDVGAATEIPEPTESHGETEAAGSAD